MKEEFFESENGWKTLWSPQGPPRFKGEDHNDDDGIGGLADLHDVPSTRNVSPECMERTPKDLLIEFLSPC